MIVDADPTLGHGLLTAGRQCAVVTDPILLMTLGTHQMTVITEEDTDIAPGTTHQMAAIMEEDIASGTTHQMTVTMTGITGTVPYPAVSHQG